MVDRSVEVHLRARVAEYNRGIDSAAVATDRLDAKLAAADTSTTRLGSSSRKAAKDLDEQGKAAQRTGAEIDKLSGRVKLYMQAAVTAGPGLIPILAQTGPLLAGTATGLAAAALAGGSLIAALQGVGDATKAVDAYNLDPTIENYEKAREALEALSPAAQQFVSDFQRFQPVLTSLRDASAEGWMPGLSDSLDNLTELAPRARDLLEDVGRAGGQALDDSTASLASDRWDEFYDLIDRQAPEAITTLTDVVGNLTHGLGQMMVAAEPGSEGFMGWVDDVADGFDRWATSDQGREDVRAFLEYAATNGPRVADFFSSVVDTTAQIVQAAAPLGGPVLTVLTAVSDVLGNVADSDAGTTLLTAAAALSVYNRAAKMTAAFSGSSVVTNRFPNGIKAAATEARAGTPRFRDFGNALAYAAHSNDVLIKSQQSGSKVAAASATNALRARTAVSEWGKAAVRATAGAAVPMAALGLIATGAADDMGISNAAAGALIGTFGGPWGIALGTAAGATLDLANYLGQDLATGIQRVDSAMQGGNIAQMQAEVDRLSASFRDAGFGTSELQRGLSTMTFGAISDDYSDAAKKILDAQAQIDQLKYEKTLTPFDPSVIGSAGNGLDLLTSGLNLTATQFDRARLAGSRFFDMVSASTGVLDRRAAWRAYQESIDAASQALKDNGKTLDNNNAKGRANNAALDAMSNTALTFAQNLKGADRIDFLRNARDGIAQAAIGFGKGRAAARRLANEIIGVDNLKAEPKVDLDDDGFKKGRNQVNGGVRQMDGTRAELLADLLDDPFQRGAGRVRGGMRGLGGLHADPLASLNDQITPGVSRAQAAINSLHGRSVTVTTYYRQVGAGVSAAKSAQSVGADGGFFGRAYGDLGLAGGLAASYANGGLYDRLADRVRAYADGGFDQDGRYFARQPQIVTGGRTIQWAEPETGWEAYISGKPSQRDRNLQIWEQAGERLGALQMGVTAAADGALAVRPARAHQAISVPTRGAGTVVRERVVERLAGRVTLSVDGRQFTAWVQSEAGDVARREIDADRQFTYDHMGG